MKTRQDILAVIQDDPWMIEVIQIAQSIGLPEWMIGAGFVRNKVWDVLQGYSVRKPLGDVDFIYFDAENIDELLEKKYEKQLKLKCDAPWSVKNQARMNEVSGGEQYASSVDALSHWPETATCTAVTLNDFSELQLIAPHGIDDLLGLVARVNPKCRGGTELFLKRMKQKNWRDKWPGISIVHDYE